MWASTATTASLRDGQPCWGSRPAITARRSASGTVCTASARWPITRRSSAGSGNSSGSFSHDSMSSTTRLRSGVSSADCNAGTVCRSNRSATGSPLPIWAVTVAPAEVPST